MGDWDKHREERAEIIALAQADPVIREQVLHGVEAALARVSDSIAGHGHRISREPFGQAQRDMETFVFAADQLKAISAVLGNLGMVVGPLRDSFESATPHIRTARDVFSHYEDYLLGVGLKQERRGEPVTMFYRRGITAGTAVHMSNPDVVVEIGMAITAASEFVSGLSDLLLEDRLRMTQADFPHNVDAPEGE